MPGKREILCHATAEMLKALAHPTRLRIIESLKEGEKCVCELAPELKLEQANISQHLSILKKQGFIVGQQRGMRTFYRICHQEVFDLVSLIHSLLEKKIRQEASLFGDDS